jgi:hypothetical protein
MCFLGSNLTRKNLSNPRDITSWHPSFMGPTRSSSILVSVAYKLALPTTSKIHLVFHVSYLKKVVGQNCRVQTILLELDEEGSLWLQPDTILNHHECQMHDRTIKEVLIQWKDTSP